MTDHPARSDSESTVVTLPASCLIAGFAALLAVSSPGLPWNLHYADLLIIPLVFTLGKAGERLAGPSLPDVLVASYLGASLLSVLLAPSGSGWLALSKQVYLAALYGVFAALAVKGRALCMVRWCGMAACAAAGLSLIAVLRYALTGASTPSLGQVMPLPYVGLVFRVTGPCGTPEMFANYLTFAVPIALALADRGPDHEKPFWKAGAGLLIAGAAATFAHGLVGVLAGGLWFLWPRWSQGPRRWMRSGLAIALAAAFVAVNLSLTVAVRKATVVYDRDPSIGAPPYPYAFHDDLTGASRATLSVSYNAMSYFLLKSAAWEAFARMPVFGIGLGRFHEAAERAYQAGRIHKLYRAADPHSTLMGRLAETGVTGGVMLALLWIGLLSWGTEAVRRSAQPWIPRVLLAGCIGLLINSVNVDIMNFRFLWVAFGLLRGLRDA